MLSAPSLGWIAYFTLAVAVFGGGPAEPGATPPGPPPQQVEDAAVSTGVTKPTDCPRLESRLHQLMLASDPDAFARDAMLDYQDGFARVEITLAGSALPSPAYGLVVEAQYGPLLQARAPLGNLCPLSNDPAVSYVRAAAAGQPDNRLPAP